MVTAPESLVVTGSAVMGNGEVLDLRTSTDAEIPALGIVYRASVLGSHFSVEFLSWPAGWADDDYRVVNVTRHIVDALLLPQVLYAGIGVRIQIEWLFPPDKPAKEAPVPWVAGEPQDPPTFEETARMVGLLHRLRWALRDFNIALLEGEDAPLLLYRSLETAVGAVLNHDGEIHAAQWDEFHEAIGSSKDEIAELLRINKGHRHGNRMEFTRDEHIAMMTTARSILIRAVVYLRKAASAAPGGGSS